MPLSSPLFTRIKLLVSILLLFAVPASAQSVLLQGKQTASGNITIDVAGPLPVTVSVTPPGPINGQGSVQTFLINLTNDVTNAGWTAALSGPGCSGPACGTLSASSGVSGATITYTVPGTVPTPPTVVLTVTSAAQTGSFATVTITLVPGQSPTIVNNATPLPATVVAANPSTIHFTPLIGSTLAVYLQSAAADTITGVQACTNGINCTTLTKACDPTNLCVGTVAGHGKVQLFYGIGLVSGLNTLLVSNSPASGSLDAVVYDLSNVVSFSGVSFTLGSATSLGILGPSVSPIGPGIVLGFLASTNNVTGVVAPYNFIPTGFGDGSAYILNNAPGTFQPSWLTTGTNWGATAAFIGGSVTPVISVSMNPTSIALQTNATQQVTATVNNDTAGVNWTITGTGCGGVSPSTSASGIPVTYTAPGSVPGGSCTLVATSITDGTKTASAPITVSAVVPISVSLVPTTATVTVSQTQIFTPTVLHDGSNAGVDWSITGTGCSGAVSPTHTASGTATTYTAPASVPGNSCTITATSTTDPTKSASATVTVIGTPIQVSVSPTTATLNVSQTDTFTATVANDPANNGVIWSVSCGSVSCGTTSQPSFEDDFNTGTLSSNWIVSNRSNVEGGGSFSPAMIDMSQGALRLELTQDGTTAGSVGAEVQLNQKLGYGTYEWTMRAPSTAATIGGSGVTAKGDVGSTFSFSGGSPVPTEIDAPEIEGQSPNTLEYTTWLNGVQSDFHSSTFSHPELAFHIYKYVWVPGSITFYLDGTVVATTTLNVPTAPAFPLANLWGTNSSSFGGVASAGVTRYMFIQKFKYSPLVTSPITYTAPSTVPSPSTVTLTATSVTDGTKSASATITINATQGPFFCNGGSIPCPAFPGAQGGGAATDGGRGGPVGGSTADGTPQVFLVTNNNDSGTGSLRSCINAFGPRTCVFRVAGIIPVLGDLTINNPFIRIAGQTAPGEVIIGGPNTGGAALRISTHDVVVQYITVSPDNAATVSGPDTGTIGIWIVNCSSIWGPLPPAPPTNTGCYNIVIDHASTRWSGNKSWITTSNFTPKAGGISGTACSGSANCGVGPNHSITTQWTLDYEPHEGHPVGYGTATDEACVSSVTAGQCLSEYETDIDFHHDMLVNVDHRIPEIGNFSTRWINNIVYNWGTYAMQELGAMTLDIINSKYIKGNLNAIGPANPHPTHWSANGPEICGPPSGYMSGNIFGPSGTNTVDSNQWGDLAVATNGENVQSETDPNPAGGICPQATNTAGIPVPASWQRSSPMPASNSFPINVDPATNLDAVLLATIGNSQHLDCNGNWVTHRDAADSRIIAEYQTGGSGGYWPNGVTFTGQPTIPQPTANWQDNPVTNFTACTETQNDGIPDAWKAAKGLPTNNATLWKTKDPGTGLTYLEDYLNKLVPVMNAATFPAASCSQSDVTAAIAAEQVHPADGDIITIPAGSCTWTGATLTQTFANSVVIQGAGATSATTGGAGTTGSDLTALTNHMGGNPFMQLTMVAGKSLRVTGIAFLEDGSSGAQGAGNLVIGGQSSAVRVDHSHFLIFIGGSKGLGLVDAVTGVADHLYINTTQGVTNDFAFLNGGNWQGETDEAGTKSWADSDHFGTNEFFYVEDTRMVGGYASDCSNGGRWVTRYSTMIGVNGMANHGTHDGDPVPIRGCRAAEVYGNIWDDTSIGPNGGAMEENNSGPALVWGNTTTKIRFIVDLSIVRQSNATYSEDIPPNGWGFCGKTQTGATSVWDGNNTTNGYPCIDQPGRGQSNLLTQNAVWPNILNTTTGTQAWPHNALSPVYVWDNTYNDAGFSPEGCITDNSGILANNRDYYQQFTATYCNAGSFNGTAGVGQGLLSARPATCTAGPGGNTPGVGYWATDTNTLYVCNPTNTWTTYYTPYVYPHPLNQ